MGRAVLPRVLSRFPREILTQIWPYTPRRIMITHINIGRIWIASDHKCIGLTKHSFKAWPQQVHVCLHAQHLPAMWQLLKILDGCRATMSDQSQFNFFLAWDSPFLGQLPFPKPYAAMSSGNQDKLVWLDRPNQLYLQHTITSHHSRSCHCRLIRSRSGDI